MSKCIYFQIIDLNPKVKYYSSKIKNIVIDTPVGVVEHFLQVIKKYEWNKEKN